MCDNKNNKNVYQQQQRWLLKPLLQLLLLGLLIQHQQQFVVLVNATPEVETAAAFQPSYVEYGKDAVNLASTNLLVQQQPNVATFDTEDVVDSSLSTARKLLAVDGDNSKIEGSGSAVVGALTDIDDDIVENADVDRSANDEDMDRIEFSGYVNDFNMQHEASIPEDILDQQHIEDEQQNAEGDGEEDIILESQRSTIRNFTSYNNNNSNNNKNNNNNNENHGNNNKNYNSDVDDDNSSNNYKRKKKKTNNNSSNKNQHKKLNNNKSNQHHHFEISVAIENDEQPNADDDSESFKNEKLKNRQQQLEAADQQQQLDDNVNLNELKFNKLTVVENSNDNEDDDDADADADADAADVVDFKWSSNNNKEQQQQYKYAEKQQNVEQEKAIGDIEDNSFRKEAAWEAEIVNDNDASAAVAVATGDDNINNNTDDDEIADATTVPRRTTTTAKTIVFVGRKTKRHGTALSTQKQQQQQQHEQFIDVADQQYDEEQQQMLYDKQEHSRHHHFNSGSGSSSSNNNNNMPTLQDDLVQEKEQKQKLLVKPDYSISYFGISTSNGSNTNTQKDMRAGATNVESFSLSDSSSSNSRGQDVLKFINEDGVTLSQHSDYVTPTLTAFEQHKAQRRNNRRTGHKSHKKKYKDYLRYVKATATTTTAIAEKPTTSQAPTMAKVVTAEIATIPTAMEEKEVSPDQQQQQERQQQRLAKLRQYKNDIKSMEKARQLPAASSPIFVLTNRRTNAATTDVLAADSSSVSEVTIKPYYEGQLSYYMETRDDEDEMKNIPGNNLGKLITTETGSNNWYRRMQPILRNGMSKQRDNKREHKHHHHQHHLHEHHLKQHQQHGAHHQHQHHHHNHHSQSLQHEHHKHLNEEQQHQASDFTDSVSSSQKVNNHDQPKQHHAYQRRMSATKKEQQPPYRPRSTPNLPLESPTAPLPPPVYHTVKQQKSSSDGALQELGHQITQMEEFDRYYRKWPHLARVQYQLNDENYRATHGGALPDANSETEYEYQLAADELEDDFNNEDDDDEDDDAEDANLPPYIKKYNRRNKQLLNLLEGTLPPPTPPKRIIWSSSVLQPGPREAAPVRLDDDYIKEKRRRYHKQHNGNTKQWSGNKDLFAEQRAASERLSDISVDDDVTATTTKTTVQTIMPRQALSLHVTQEGQQQQQQGQHPLNVIPGDDVDISSSSSQEFDDWEKEIAASVKGSEKMKWQIENSAAATTTVATPTTTTTLKPAVFRLPSYPGFAGSFIGKPRSRSSQFAPSSGSSIISSSSSSGSRLLPGTAGNRGGNSFITNALHTGNYKSVMDVRDSSITSDNNNNIAPPTSVPPSSSVTVAAAAKPLSNSFVYHRVEAAPRVVGAGFTGHKQRLPFVAITDRRLETSKKSFALLERQRNDFEQNHYPMP